METIGHHTCTKNGTKEHVLEKSPFKSNYCTKENKLQFLGSGYYFWDNNVEMAKYWGKTHYKNNYYIIEAKLKLEKPYFIDLVGNRGDMLYFRELISIFAEEKHFKENWSIGQFVEFLKNQNNKEIFPFKVIRAVDNSIIKNKNKLKFVKDKPNYMLLNPRIIICITEIDDNILQSKNILQ